MKVVFCTDGIFPHAVGGMQRHSRLLIKELAKRADVEITVIHPHRQKAFGSNENIKEEVIQGIDESRNYLLECYRYSKRVYSVLEKYPDHVIYSQGLSVWYNINKISGRLIINPHGLEPYQAISLKDKITGIPFKIIFNYFFSHAAKVVSLGGRLTDILKIRISKSKIAVIPNATNLPVEELPEKDYSGKLQILFVARFASNKGIHILLEAIEQLNKRGYKDKIKWNLGGKGPLFNHYVENFNYENVNYLGFVSDEQLAELYKTNHLFVFPTLFEGMPTVVLEAMSYGMPVIVSDVGATAELVDAANGYLIEKNNVDALINAVVDFLKLPDADKKQLSINSYRKVRENFTWEAIAQRHVELFKSLL